MPRNALGTTIAKYKYNTSTKIANSHDIAFIVDRLETYQRYQQELRKERRVYREKQERKVIKKFKKQVYRKLYSNKPVANPYVELYKRITTAPDPKLMERYRQSNIYMIAEFRHLTLPKSGHKLTAGKAWHGLINSWTGYKASRYYENEQRESMYASATQKWSYYLDLPIPHFPDIGVSSEGFLNALKLRQYFKGYENEKIGDEF